MSEQSTHQASSAGSDAGKSAASAHLSPTQGTHQPTQMRSVCAFADARRTALVLLIDALALAASLVLVITAWPVGL